MVGRIGGIKAPITICIDGKAWNRATKQRITGCGAKDIHIGGGEDATDDLTVFRGCICCCVGGDRGIIGAGHCHRDGLISGCTVAVGDTGHKGLRCNLSLGQGLGQGVVNGVTPLAAIAIEAQAAVGASGINNRPRLGITSIDI